MRPIPTEADLKVHDELERLDLFYGSRPFDEPHFRGAVSSYAEAFLGVREIGTTNAGYWIDRFLKDVGLNPGFAWCLALVQFVVKRASMILGQTDLIPLDTAGTQKFAGWIEENFIDVTDVAQLSPGDIPVWRNGKGSGLGHTGIITRVDKENKIIYTVEGNTSKANYRDGGWVAEKTYTFDEFSEIGIAKSGRYLRTVLSLELLIKKYNG